MSEPRRALLEPNPYDEPECQGQPAAADGLEWIRSLNWQQFESLVATAYRLQGFEVTLTKTGADGGIDLVLTRGDQRTLVQCKHWKAYQVGAPVARELLGLVVAHHAAGGVLVTSGSFSQEAVAFGCEQGLQLLDGPATLRLITTGLTLPTDQPTSRPRPRATVAIPPCPVCGSSMALRTARRGAHAGRQFWGCTRYPSCRGIVEAAPLASTAAVTRPAPVRTRPRPTLSRRVGFAVLRMLAVAALAGLTGLALYFVMTGFLLPMLTRGL